MRQRSDRLAVPGRGRLRKDAIMSAPTSLSRELRRECARPLLWQWGYRVSQPLMPVAMTTNQRCTIIGRLSLVCTKNFICIQHTVVCKFLEFSVLRPRRVPPAIAPYSMDLLLLLAVLLTRRSSAAPRGLAPPLGGHVGSVAIGRPGKITKKPLAGTSGLRGCYGPDLRATARARVIVRKCQRCDFPWVPCSPSC
jgi:hypothetical protein